MYSKPCSNTTTASEITRAKKNTYHTRLYTNTYVQYHSSEFRFNARLRRPHTTTKANARATPATTESDKYFLNMVNIIIMKPGLCRGSNPGPTRRGVWRAALGPRPRPPAHAPHCRGRHASHTALEVIYPLFRSITLKSPSRNSLTHTHTHDQ